MISTELLSLVNSVDYSMLTNNVGMMLDANNITFTNKGLDHLGAGLATTGCLGAGIGQGFSAGKANEALSRNPEMLRRIQTVFIVGAAIAESGAIYSLLVALILLFVAS